MTPDDGHKYINIDIMIIDGVAHVLCLHIVIQHAN